MGNRPPQHVSLDAMLLSLKETGRETQGVMLKNDPPVIFDSPKLDLISSSSPGSPS